MTTIREEDVLEALRKLETTRWEEVLDFIGYLRRRIKPEIAIEGARGHDQTLTGRRLAVSDLMGLWSDRMGLPDSPEYARQVRRQPEHIAHSGSR